MQRPVCASVCVHLRMRLCVHACQEEHKFNTTPNLDGFNDIRLEKDGGVDASINSV